MSNKHLVLAGCLSVLLSPIAALAGETVAPSAFQPVECDRACLIGHIDRYMAALVAHDPARLPWAEHVAFTENNVPLQIGDGLWRTITKHRPYKVYVADPQAGQVVYYGVVEESGVGAILTLRLKIEGQRIAEAETLLARKRPNELFPNPDGLENKTIFDEVLPPERRRSREQLITVANAYFETVQQNDGTIYIPLDPRCHRIEIGVATTNNTSLQDGSGNSLPSMGCREQFLSGNFIFVTEIRARRFLAVDVERGLVMTSGFFDHAGSIRSVKLTTGKEQKIGIPWNTPYSFMYFELFKIDDGKLLQVESTLEDVSYRDPSPWQTTPRVRPMKAPATSTAACNRQCLEGQLDQYLQALLRRDGGQLPWAKHVVFTENNVALKIGQGLWGTADELAGSSLRVADVQTGQVGFVGSVREDDHWSPLALRLRIVDGRIADVETFVARNYKVSAPLPASSLAGLVDVVPEAARMSRDRMVAIADGHYADVPPEVTQVRSRRFPLVDEELGIVWTAAFFDLAGTVKPAKLRGGAVPQWSGRPWTWQVVDLMKISKGKIAGALNIRAQAPYGFRDVWAD